MRTRLEGWGHARSSPARRWSRFDGNSYWTEDRHWIDHAYRLRTERGMVFVSEPYTLGEESLEDLLDLRTEGWNVSLDGLGKHHETTIRIVLWRGREGSA